MFGSKKGKQDALDKAVNFMEAHGEVTQTELARELNVSPDAMEDYLASLEARGDLLCQKGRKLSLFKRRFGNNRG